MDDLTSNLVAQLDEPRLLWPGFVGYFSWNYEAALALEGLGSSPFEVDISQTLQEGLSFPQPGYWIEREYPVMWLYSPGDRIGLFGSLYRNNVNPRMYCYSTTKNADWPEHEHCKTRLLGWGGAAGIGLRLRHVWLWADDVYMAGIPLLFDQPDALLAMLQGARAVLKDDATQLWWHGVKIINDGDEYEPNGVKWGRAHAWILLTLARYVSRTEGDEVEWLAEEVDIARSWQRPSGAFGNIVDEPSSPDETSLTSAFVYAVGVLNRFSVAPVGGNVTDSAFDALNWLETRHVDGLLLSDTAGAAHMSDDAADYNAVVGLAEGPAIGLAVWARIGLALLTDANATEYAPWLDGPTPDCPERVTYSGVFYFLAISGLLLSFASCALCCKKCKCCAPCKRQCCDKPLQAIKDLKDKRDLQKGLVKSEGKPLVSQQRTTLDR